LIQNNTAVSNNNSGIGDTLEITNRSGNNTGAGNSSTLNLTILGNNLTQLNGGGDVFQVSNSVMTTTTVNLDLNSDNIPANRNTFTGGDADGVLLRNDAGTFRIEDLVGGAEAFVEARNNGNVTVTGTIVATGDVPLPSNPSFLMAAAGGVEGLGGAGAGNLSAEALDTLLDAALLRWAMAGISADQLAALEQLSITVADLDGDQLGAHTAAGIVIDSDAAGHGWFIDETPLDDVEFATVLASTQLHTSAAEAPAGLMDLLTVVMHEMGHELGLEDTYDLAAASDLMFGSLVTGERRLPDAAPGTAVQTSGDHFDFASIAALRADGAGLSHAWLT
jgi:hypothetical protein